MNKLLLALLLLTTACTSGIKLNLLVSNENVVALAPFEPFAFIEEDTLPQLKGTLLGEFEIDAKAFTVDCSYEEVKRQAIDQARSIGGNAVLVKEHRLPDSQSRCHRIKGEIWSLEDPRAYEKIITWYPQRRLKIEDFKADTLNRPFQAVTVSRFIYRTSVNRMTGSTDLQVESVFNCELSYFVPSAYDSLVLEHEQLHFDITEIFARKFCERLQAECETYEVFTAKHERICREIEVEMTKKQEEYDRDVVKDDSLQQKWVSWVAGELRATAAFADKHIRF